ncbi:MAG: hypothetical protein CL685_03680 [Candidatus Magasanikbacteria bacterium]|nr:hypothetical protein [Candidatus Magasanikbacteria bacterium]
MLILKKERTLMEEPPFQPVYIPEVSHLKPKNNEEGAETTVYSRLEGPDINGFRAGFCELTITTGREPKRSVNATITIGSICVFLYWCYVVFSPPEWLLWLGMAILSILALIFGEMSNPQASNPKRATYLVAQIDNRLFNLTFKLRNLKKVVWGFLFGRSISKYSIFFNAPIYFVIWCAHTTGQAECLEEWDKVVVMLVFSAFSEWMAQRHFFRDWNEWNFPGIRRRK